MQDRIVRGGEFRRQCGGVSVATFYRWTRQADFPARVEISPGVFGYWESQVKAWLESRPCKPITESPALAAARNRYWADVHAGKRERLSPRAKAHRDAVKAA